MYSREDIIGRITTAIEKIDDAKLAQIHNSLIDEELTVQDGEFVSQNDDIAVLDRWFAQADLEVEVKGTDGWVCVKPNEYHRTIYVETDNADSKKMLLKVFFTPGICEVDCALLDDEWVVKTPT